MKIILFFLLCVVSISIHSNEYYVDAANGNDSACSGRKDTPCRTLARTLHFVSVSGEKLTPNVTIFFADGIYEENAYIILRPYMTLVGNDSTFLFFNNGVWLDDWGCEFSHLSLRNFALVKFGRSCEFHNSLMNVFALSLFNMTIQTNVTCVFKQRKQSYYGIIMDGVYLEGTFVMENINITKLISTSNFGTLNFTYEADIVPSIEAAGLYNEGNMSISNQSPYLIMEMLMCVGNEIAFNGVKMGLLKVDAGSYLMIGDGKSAVVDCSSNILYNPNVVNWHNVVYQPPINLRTKINCDTRTGEGVSKIVPSCEMHELWTVECTVPSKISTPVLKNNGSVVFYGSFICLVIVFFYYNHFFKLL